MAPAMRYTVLSKEPCIVSKELCVWLKEPCMVSNWAAQHAALDLLRCTIQSCQQSIIKRAINIPSNEPCNKGRSTLFESPWPPHLRSKTLSKETCTLSREPYIVSHETSNMSNEPSRVSKESYDLSKKPCTASNETSLIVSAYRECAAR